MHPRTIGALFRFTFSKNDDIPQEFFVSEAVSTIKTMEDWERCVLYFTAGDIGSFCQNTSQVVQNMGRGRERDRIMNLISSAVEEYSRFHILTAFDDTADPHLGLESRQTIHTLFAQLPGKILTSDPDLCQLLLKPVCVLLESELSNASGSSGRVKQFYVDVDILSQWHRADPRLWNQIAQGFRITDEVTQIIQDEIELIASDPDSLGSSTPVRSRLNQFLHAFLGNRQAGALRDFLSVFDGLWDLFDLIDLEMFLEVFPEEMYLKTGSGRYKPSFSRKLALTCVKKWVNDHQHYKKNKDTVSRRSLPAKEDVITACVIAHLDITGATKRDRDCEYFWSHLRKTWLGIVLRSKSLTIFEIHDHLEDDMVLLNQCLLHLEEANDTQEIAQLLLLSEPLRIERLRRMQLDDPLVLMWMSTMQMGAYDRSTQFFGPRMTQGFVLPFSIDFELRGSSTIDPDSYSVLVVDQPAQLEAMEIYLLDVSVVAVDVFYKVFWSGRLERTVPSVVCLATEKKVFIVMTNRMVRNSKSFHASVKTFFKRFLSDQSVLKVVGAMRNTEKDFFLWTLLVDNPFEQSLDDSSLVLCPFLDIVDVYPRRSFSDLVYHLLGGLRFCDFEQNCNWSRADSDLLRQTQLHFIASKCWLLLQLFHTVKAQDARDISPMLTALDCSQVFGPRFNSEWKMHNEEKIEATETWTVENEDKLQRARRLVESSQSQLRDSIKQELSGNDDEEKSALDFQLTDEYSLAD